MGLKALLRGRIRGQARGRQMAPRRAAGMLSALARPPWAGLTVGAALPGEPRLITLRYPLVTLERWRKIKPLKANDLSSLPGLGAPPPKGLKRKSDGSP